MPAPANQYEAPFKACIGEAARRGKHLMERLVDQALQSSPQHASLAGDTDERTAQHEAARLLLQYRPVLCGEFPQALLAEFAQAIAGAGDKAAAKGLSFDALELMGDDQVQERVEQVRAQQAASQAVEAELGELNALVCAAQGLKTVQADRNPLRPEIFVRALGTVIAATGVAASVRLRWMQYLGEALGPELARVYADLSLLLRGQGVEAAGFNVIHAPESVAAPRQGAGVTGPASEPARHPADTLLTVTQLRRLLSGGYDAGRESFDARFTREFEAGGQSIARPEFSPTVPAAFEALQEMKQVDQVMQRLADRRAAQPGRAMPADGTDLRAQLRQQARGTGQALGLEVVGLMVDNIASDPRLLREVQQTVRDLEPALLRLALIDPRFFSDKRHPARRLLDQFTGKSMAWPTADAAGFAAFLEPARQAVQALLTTGKEGAEPFAFALQSLEEVWDEQSRHERRKREKAVQALLQAEQRNLLAEKIARDLRRRAETAGAPRGIVYFVAGPWAQAIAQARLTDPQGRADPEGYEDLVTDLLWSAMPEVASSNPARLARLIPGLLAKLREGLERIGYSRSKSNRFFDELMALHARAGRAAAAPVSAPLDARARLEAQFREADEAGLWLAPSEAQDSGFLETQPPASVVPRPLFEATQPGFDDTRIETEPRAEEATAAAPTVVGQIEPGAWVELRMDEGWVRTQLTWASPHGTLFMFSNAEGVNHSMTRQSMDRLAASGNLRVLSNQAVVEGALDAVAQAALRNSVDFTL
ncbi:MAG: DUF1631 family protein [Ramlibacter sp.]|nr:DUF1631 family protein [Ramlibacter sp.]